MRKQINLRVVTRCGRLVAKLLAVVQKRELSVTQQKAWKQLLAQLRKGYHLGKEKFDRDRAHER